MLRMRHIRQCRCMLWRCQSETSGAVFGSPSDRASLPFASQCPTTLGSLRTCTVGSSRDPRAPLERVNATRQGSIRIGRLRPLANRRPARSQESQHLDRGLSSGPIPRDWKARTVEIRSARRVVPSHYGRTPSGLPRDRRRLDHPSSPIPLLSSAEPILALPDSKPSQASQDFRPDSNQHHRPGHQA